MGRPTTERCIFCGQPIQLDDKIMAVVEGTGQLFHPDGSLNNLVVKYPFHLACFEHPEKRHRGRRKAGREADAKKTDRDKEMEG